MMLVLAPISIKRWSSILLHTCQKIGKVQYLAIGNRRDDIGHRIVVAAARIVLIAAQRLDEIILSLIGDTRHVLLPRETRRMAHVAVVLLDQCASPRHTRFIAGPGGWLRRR